MGSIATATRAGTRASPDAAPPSAALWLREATALAGLAGYAMSWPWWGSAPRGDGHPVWVLPGLVQSDASTLPLRAFLSGRGHRVRRAAFGLNTGRTRLVDDVLLPRLLAAFERDGRPVSLVGWSMGGLFARELALRLPQAVRQVVTLGSPFAGPAKASNVWRLYEALSGERAGDPRVVVRFRGPLAVPSSAIYSRRDGIVAWRGCVQDLERTLAPAENIEVSSTHLGLGHHPAVLFALADRLAQAEGAWTPFAPGPAWRWMYPTLQASTVRPQDTRGDPP